MDGGMSFVAPDDFLPPSEYLSQLDNQYGLPSGWLEGVQQGESSGGTDLGSTGAFQLTQGWINQYAPGTPYGSYAVGTPQWQQQAQAVAQFFGTQGATPAALQAYTGSATPPNAAYANLWGLAGGSSSPLATAAAGAASAAGFGGSPGGSSGFFDALGDLGDALAGRVVIMAIGVALILAAVFLMSGQSVLQPLVKEMRA